MRNWMLTKVAYDRNIGETLSAKFDAISLHVGLDPVTTPLMPSFPDQLSRPWESEAPPYEEDDEHDEE